MATAFSPLLRCYGVFGRPAIDGTWKNFVSDFGAVADGVMSPTFDGNGVVSGYTMTGTSNSTAMAAWWDYGIAQGTAAAKLYIPPGNYHFAGSSSLSGYDPSGNPLDSASQTILNGYVSAWGAVFDTTYIGPAATILQDQIHSARFATTVIGATSLTLINSGPHLTTDISRFAVGQWIMISGCTTQNYGYPFNPHFFEYRQITAINSNTISFTDPLIYAYKSTWPEIDLKAVTVTSASPAVVTLTAHGFSADQTIFFDIPSGGAVPTGVTRHQTYFVISAGLAANTFRFSDTMGGAAISTSSTGTSVHIHTQSEDLGGPATVHGLRENFKSSIEVYGLRVTSSSQVAIVGAQSAFLCGMQFDGDGPAPTVGRSITIRRTQIGKQNEVDKAVENLVYNECSSTHPSGTHNIDLQSSSVRNFTLKNSTITLSGTAKNTTIDRCTIPLLTCGPTAYGHGSTLTISNTTVTTANMSARYALLSTLTFTNDVFSIALVAAANAHATFVPGTKMAFGIYAGGIVITDDSAAVHSFSVVDIRQDATTMFIDVSGIGASLPSLTYQGGPATLVANFAVDTGGLTTSNYTGPSLAGFVAP